MSRVAGRIRKAPQANEALRAHVTRVGFDLTLGRTHIASLVYLNESIERGGYIKTTGMAGALARSFSFFASGIRGCEDRGLTIHHYNPDRRDEGLGAHYTITRAGQLVIELLRESGLYAEYAAVLPVLEASA